MNLDQFRAQALHLTATLVPVSRCLFYEVGPDLEPRGHVVYGNDRRYIESYLQQYRLCDPFHPRHFSKHTRSVFGTDEGAGTPLMRERYLHDFRVPMGVRYKAEVFLRDDLGAIIGGLRMSRREELGEFEGRDIAALEAVQPVLQTAFQAVRCRDVASSVHDQLTVREREVLDCILDGMCNKLIARKLGLALPTVKSHVKGVLRKVGATSRAEVISRLCRTHQGAQSSQGMMVHLPCAG